MALDDLALLERFPAAGFALTQAAAGRADAHVEMRGRGIDIARPRGRC